jgi:hypothetical protein
VALAAVVLLAGCKETPARNASAVSPQAQVVQYPARPSLAPPAFKVFHHDATTITLVTKEDASDAEIESLIWELRDATHARALDKLKISQKMIDDRSPIVWIHVYRGAKCASEKYASGTPPCGASYHAAGDYTYGGYTNHNRDDGVLLHDEDHEIELWNPDAPYAAPNVTLTPGS